MQKVYEYTAERRDIDANHHVNNISYLDIAYNALPEDVGLNFKSLEIYYKRQTKLGEKVNMYYTKTEDAYVIAIKSEDGKTLHTILKFYYK